jgi:hypothetical protein
MPSRDIYHDHVVNALIRDGWTITDDPLRLRIGKKDLFVDLGAERLLQAEKGTLKIAVEVKSFIGPSDVSDLHEAVGQYILYHDVLQETQPERLLYLAVRNTTYASIFQIPIGELLLRNSRLRLLVFDVEQEVVEKWIPILPIEN